MKSFLYLLIIALCFGAEYGDSKRWRIAVAITSIPPRFPTLSRSISSWFQQLYPVCKVFIFLPRNYKRFRRKGKFSSRTPSILLSARLSTDIFLGSLLANGSLSIIEMTRDYGPITKLVGASLMSNSEHLDYWLFADDDVGYATHTTLKYAHSLALYQQQQSQIDISKLALTNFIEDYRLLYSLDGDATPRLVPHLQGVDTYLLRQSSLQYGILRYGQLVQIIDFFHLICPESFFQDDYLVSFLVHLSGLILHSIWDPTGQHNLVQHLEGASKSGYQMHMDPTVFLREEATKDCILSYANTVHRLFAVHPTSF
jgi:hypothetical protein